MFQERSSTRYVIGTHPVKGIFTYSFVTKARFPERYHPGAFDVWGSSHQIFHIMVVLGAVLHFYGILASLDYRYDPRTRFSRQCGA